MGKLEEELFSSRTRLYDCFPGGNDTFIIMNGSFEREHYPRLNKMVLDQHPKFEQGAVLEGPSRGGVLRMQMTGGEFCGNATRSAAALVAETFTRGKELDAVANYDAIREECDTLSFPLEVSGTDNLVSATATPTEYGWDVEIELPRMAQRNVAYDVPIMFGADTIPCTVVTLEGISHVLIPESEMAFDNNQAKLQMMVADVITQLKWADMGAFGLIWVKHDDEQVAIEPVVFVKSNQTCIYESACGSGTIAVALATAQEGQSTSTSVRQPSGAVLKATIDQSDSDKGVGAKLRGPVEIRGDLNACSTSDQPLAVGA